MKEMSMFAVEMKAALEKAFQYFEYLTDEEKIEMINWTKINMAKYNPIQEPVDVTIWVKAEKVVANDYNPNKVAPPEMELLHHSILTDGFTQPIVTMSDRKTDTYVTVDGFHRKEIGAKRKDIRNRMFGYLPITLVNKPIEERMAATIRHNRARGKHGVNPMSDIVASLYKKSWSDERIAKELGMDFDEVLRLKQITGLPGIFKDREFSRSWE